MHKLAIDHEHPESPSSPCAIAILIPVVKPPDFRYNQNVRLDLFLKTSRLIKRRTLAREMCENGRVLVNGREAKPAKEVSPGDEITLKFSTRTIDLEVTRVLAASSRKTSPEELYRVKSETRLPMEKDRWSENLS